MVGSGSREAQYSEGWILRSRIREWRRTEEKRPKRDGKSTVEPQNVSGNRERERERDGAVKRGKWVAKLEKERVEMGTGKGKGKPQLAR